MMPGARDETRARGLFAGAAVGAAVLVAGVAALHGPTALVSPGPPAWPHRELGCSDCHRGAPASSGCTTCHGNHPSRRDGHRELAEVGALRCGDCHAVHRAEQGVRFEPDGHAVFFGTGFETPLSPRLLGAPDVTVTVPLVETRACARCHDLTRGDDPAAACAPAGGGSLSTCFDEHRPPVGASPGARAEREAAVEAARAVAATPPPAPFLRSLFGQALLLGGALASGLAGAFARRRFSRARSRPALVPVAPATGPRRLPLIDATRCLGCHACVDACPYDVLEVRRYAAVVARPDACCGAGPCEARCPNGSLVLASEGPSPPAVLSGDLEVRDRPGVFLAGDITGGSLIRNALRQGVAVAHAVKRRTPAARRDDGVADLVVIGAGPAGLAAALACRELGLRAVVLEQATLADSIRRFSRQKLVLDTGDPDERLPLFIGDVLKEELVERWSYDVRRARLELREGLRAVDLEPPDDGGVHRVVVEDGAGGRFGVPGRAVLVAIGRRGTPRELDVPLDAGVRPRVHYELSDARAFSGKRAVVVGLGDVAMETALALAAQPGTRVAVVHRGDGFRRGKKRNIEALSALVARGRVELLLSARVTGVSSDGVAVETAGARRVLGFDVLFVAIGSLPRSELATAAGVCVPS